MSGATRYKVIETALCIGESVFEGEVVMVLASEHERLDRECDSVAGKLRTALLDKAQIEAERDAALKQVEGLRETLEKISAYAPCSGIKDPGFTKMHMGILARDAIAALEANT